MWEEIYKKAIAETKNHGPLNRFFRGHADSAWRLLPGLGRLGIEYQENEAFAYFDYGAMAGALLPAGASSWEKAVSMQHHGLPTRLLDWTDNFAVALFFALREKPEETSCIWILDPFLLNEKLASTAELFDILELRGSYDEAFGNEHNSMGAKVVSFVPGRHHPRVSSQKSMFTMHYDLQHPIEEICAAAVTKIEIPAPAKKDAWEFLRLAGISEFSLFPDLDGLSRELKRAHFE